MPVKNLTNCDSYFVHQFWHRTVQIIYNKHLISCQMNKLHKILVAFISSTSDIIPHISVLCSCVYQQTMTQTFAHTKISHGNLDSTATISVGVLR